jgi:hypothetical protein
MWRGKGQEKIEKKWNGKRRGVGKDVKRLGGGMGIDGKRWKEMEGSEGK